MAKIKFFSKDMMVNGDPLRSEIGNYYSFVSRFDETRLVAVPVVR